LLYNWRDRFEETDPVQTRSRELIFRKQITDLKRLLANKAPSQHELLIGKSPCQQIAGCNV
jgi:hypothetical protein